MRRLMVAFALLFGLAAAAQASPMVYQPVNPNFGGSPLNGPFLLGEAASNNYDHLTNPNATANLLGVQQQTTADLLRQALISALISQASTLAINDILGANGANSGTFTIGGEIITFVREGGNINITLTDPSGSQTQVSVPIPQF